MEKIIEKFSKNFPLSRSFHQNSKYVRSMMALQSKSITDFTNNWDRVYESSQAHQSYAGVQKISLSTSRFPIWTRSIWSLLSGRRSGLTKPGKRISFFHISKILTASAGVSKSLLIPKTNGLLQHFRSYPSAGALYPLELYVVYFENDVASLFHFEPTENRVAVLAHDIARADFVKHSVFQDDIHNANAFFVITANMMRTMTKYGERGYRFVMIETGHLAQNILLTSEALGLRTCPIGRFLDDELKQFLKIDASEDLLYVIAIN